MTDRSLINAVGIFFHGMVFLLLACTPGAVNANANEELYHVNTSDAPVATSIPVLAQSDPGVHAVGAKEVRRSSGSGILGVPDFENASILDYSSLLDLYMATNHDILDNEAFAWEYYRVRHIEPGAARSQSADCHALFLSMQNQFEREDRMRQARTLAQAALRKSAGAPKTAVFKMTGTVRLRDHESGSFGLRMAMQEHLFGGKVHVARTSRATSAKAYNVVHHCGARWQSPGVITDTRGLPGTEVMPSHTGFELNIIPDERLTKLPMSAEQAREYVESLPRKGSRIDPSIVLETLIEVGPAHFTAGSRGVIPARIIAARALHPETAEVVHLFDLTPADGEAEPVEPLGLEALVASMTDFRLAYLLLRDNPQLLSESLVANLVRRQIESEQACYSAMERFASQGGRRLQLNPDLPMITRAWQSTGSDDPASASLLDVFRAPDSDWTFSRQTPGYDARFNHLIDAFIFDVSVIRGREPSFLAPELAPVFSGHLAAVLNGAPERLQTTYALPGVRYDFDAEAFRFVGGNNELINHVSVLPNDGADSGVGARSAAQVGGFLYDVIAHGYRRPGEGPKRPGVDYRCLSPTEQWRDNLASLIRRGSGRNIVTPVLVFGHDLSVASVSQPAAEAENLVQKLDFRGEGLMARVFFRITKVTISEQGGRSMALFHSELDNVEILAPDGSVLALLDPDDFSTYERLAAIEAELRAPRAPEVTTVPEPLLPVAETIDLLVTKFLPGELDSEMIERMIDARWAYENEVAPTDTPAWGGFFLREREGERFILDRPSVDEKSVQLFRQWTLDRAAKLPAELTFRFPLSEAQPGILAFPGSNLRDDIGIRSEVASCWRQVETRRGIGDIAGAKTLEPSCQLLQASVELPSEIIEFRDSLHQNWIGPRSVCPAVQPGDSYCSASSAHQRKRGAPPLLDLFATDRLVQLGPELARDKGSEVVVELVTRIEDVEVSNKLFGRPWHVATERDRPLPSGAQQAYLWRLSAVSARLFNVETGEPLEDLELLPLPALPVARQDAVMPGMRRGGRNIGEIELGMPFDEAERLLHDQMAVAVELVSDRGSRIGTAVGKITPYASGRFFLGRW